jgi:hypothetical protein
MRRALYTFFFIKWQCPGLIRDGHVWNAISVGSVTLIKVHPSPPQHPIAALKLTFYFLLLQEQRIYWAWRTHIGSRWYTAMFRCREGCGWIMAGVGIFGDQYGRLTARLISWGDKNEAGTDIFPLHKLSILYTKVLIPLIVSFRYDIVLAKSPSWSQCDIDQRSCFYNDFVKRQWSINMLQYRCPGLSFQANSFLITIKATTLQGVYFILYIFLPLHVSALAGHLKAEYTIVLGSYFTHSGSVVLFITSHLLYIFGKYCRCLFNMCLWVVQTWTNHFVVNC